MRALKDVARSGLDVLLPPQCLVCDTVVEETGRLCPACWSALRFIEEPLCAACGLPFETEAAEGAMCAACIADPPPYDRARAAIAYDDGSRRIILAFKHGDRIDGASTFGRWMARAGAPVLASADVLVPVPLHWTRLIRRRYNQAALLAQAVGRETGIRVIPDLIVRRKRTVRLGDLGPEARRQTVQGAFRLRRWPKVDRAADVAGRRIVLIDDVLTTGATVGACIRTLKGAGAATVDVLSLARVVRPRLPGR
jgi:ComF family protein